MNTVTSIKEEIRYRGYNPNLEIIIPSRELKEIGLLLEHPLLAQTPQKKDTLSNTKKSTKNFYKRHFILQRIPIFSEHRIGPLNIEFQKNKSPFKLPINQEPDTDSFYGCLREVISLEDERFLISYRVLDLSSNITEISKLSYTHEIAHTQLNHAKGVIQNYYNTEVISIFLETLHAYEENSNERLLVIHDSERLTELKNIINELSIQEPNLDETRENCLIEASLYAESTLKAYNLFIKYYFSNPKIKKEILSSIQRLFNYEITLEELLAHFDATFESSQNPSHIKKYINR